MLLNNCKKASIYTIQNHFLCDAAVSDIQENSARLTMEEMEDAASDFLGSECHVTFYDGVKGLVTYHCTITDHKESEVTPGVINISIECHIGEQLSALQRRNDLKVPVSIPVTLNFAGRSSRPIDIPGTIRNISAGGIFVTCRYSFRPGDFVSFPLVLKENTPPDILTVQVLRIQDREPLHDIIGREADDESLFGFGCRFAGMPSRTEAQIRNFVFRQDLLHRKTRTLG